MSEKMFITVRVGTKKQFKMYLDEELLDRLRRAAEKSGKSSGQDVAEEVITIYLPVWLQVSESVDRAIRYQTAQVVRKKTSRKTERVPVEPEAEA